jgi:hypothetical protein
LLVPNFEQLNSLPLLIGKLGMLHGAAFLAGGAYFAVVSHITCAVAVLEDAFLFGAVRKSHKLNLNKLGNLKVLGGGGHLRPARRLLRGFADILQFAGA